MKTLTKNRKKQTIPRRRSLRLKWMGLISTAVLVSLLGSTLMLFVTVKSSLEDTFMRTNKVQVESAAREMRMFIVQYEKLVEQLAKAIAMAERSSVNADQSVERLLEETMDDDSSLLGVYFISASTGNLQISPKSGNQMDARELPVYKLVMKNNDTSWTNVRQDDLTRKMTVSIVTPVKSADQLYGVVGFDIDLKGIGTLRESMERFGKNKIVIFDNQGLIISSFMKGMDGKNINPSGSASAKDVIRDRKLMQRTFGWVAEVIAGPESAIDFQWENVNYTGEVSYVYSVDWAVVSFVDKSVLLGSLTEFVIMSAIALVIGLFIGAFAAYYIATRLLKTIHSLRSTIAKTAAGDLVAQFEYDENDEIGDLAGSYNAMLASMRSLIQSVNFSVKTVEDSANEVSQIANESVVTGTEVARTTEEIAVGASNTAMEVEKSSEAVHRLNIEIGTLIAQSKEIEEVLVEAGEQISQSNIQVDNLESSYTELEKAFHEVSGMVADLHVRSQTISDVTKAIENITKQTDILSINASIEAARAGEHGRGFAVVANEVRNFSEQARQSAKHIQETISAILSLTLTLVDVVNNTNAVNDTQKLAVSRVSRAMKSMNASLHKIQEHIQGEIGTISHIEDLKERVVSSIRYISTVSEQTTASTEEIVSSVHVQAGSIREVSNHAGQLVGLIAELKEAVMKFKTD